MNSPLIISIVGDHQLRSRSVQFYLWDFDWNYSLNQPKNFKFSFIELCLFLRDLRQKKIPLKVAIFLDVRRPFEYGDSQIALDILLENLE